MGKLIDKQISKYLNGMLLWIYKYVFTGWNTSFKGKFFF